MNDLSSFNRMMVCLDLSEMDEVLLKYASSISKIFGIETVYFVHVTNTLELTEEIRAKYPDLEAPLDESIEHQIASAIDQHFIKPNQTEVKISVVSGKITDEIIKLSKNKLIDLTLIGRKKYFRSSGMDERKMAKASPTSVILVPEEPRLKIEKILVSIDYSDHSQMAFEIGMAIQQNSGAKLLSNNIYKVPNGYHSMGKTYEEFAEIMLENTKNECEKFFKKMDMRGIDFEHTYMLDDDPKPADKIYKTAKENDVDMIILGSKGRSAAAAFLLGSVAEKLMLENNDIPLFIVKKSGENQSFIKTLLKL